MTHSLPANMPGQPVLDRSAVWDGLVQKANNALPFVPSMSRCEVIDRIAPHVFDRRIELRGDEFVERITLEEPHRVVFTRLAGPVLGTIANEIEEVDGELRLRFSFALTLGGAAAGSAQEDEYASTMTTDYLKAVDSTLEAMRRVAVERVGVSA